MARARIFVYMISWLYGDTSAIFTDIWYLQIYKIFFKKIEKI